MEITKKRIQKLHPPEKNVRKHSEKQLQEMIRSIEMFGQIRPIVIDESDVILCGNALTEFTGIDTDKMSFELTLTSELCVDVMGELTKIWTYERKATTLPLVIGEKAYGKYRWTIKNHKIAMRHFDSMGNLTTAIVSINLLEYLSV